MRIAYLDCSSGVSGDMLLAAGISAGASLDRISAVLRRLGLAVELEAELVERQGMRATRLLCKREDGTRRVLGSEAGDLAAGAAEHRHGHGAHSHEAGHGHEPGHLHHEPGGGEHDHGGRAHRHDAAHRHEAEASHPHVPPPAPRRRAGRGGAPHGSRTLTEILGLLDRAGLAPTVAARARAVFQALGQAEARVHGVPIEHIHFHEVGQDDAIVDIVGTAMAYEELGINRLQCSPLNVGSGTVTCAHGRFAVPAPATMELLRGLPIYSDGVEAELVTPTGAALVRTLAQGFGAMPPLRPELVGYGVGSYELAGHADVLRMIVGRAVEMPAAQSGEPASSQAAADAATVAVIEANLDDLNPQFYGYLVERALALGALDIYSVPAQMKKNRPGLLVTILARREQAAECERLLLEETTTLGVRVHWARRTTLERSAVSVETAYGAIHIKIGMAQGRLVNAAPEYEDCREAALRHNVPLKQVYQEALRIYLNEARPAPAPAAETHS